MMDKELIKSKLKNANKDQWSELYNNTFVKLEELTPFNKDKPKYRFEWVLKNVDTGKKILDVGSGNGTLAHYLQEKGLKVDGLEVSEQANISAMRNVPGVTFTTGFIEDAPYNDESFDYVSCLEVVEHLPEPQQAVKNMIKLLKPGGKLLMSVPFKKHFDCAQHLNHYDFYDLYDLFEPIEDVADFKIYRIYKFGPHEKGRYLWGCEVWKNKTK